MNKPSAIFQEIENKLIKDDYASKLPTYHPAKGRRKRVIKETTSMSEKDNFNTRPDETHHTTGFTDFKGHSEEPDPRVLPEIEEPEEKEISPPTPGEREIDPERDLPHRDIPHPDEEEMPGVEPKPEIEDPGRIGGVF